LITFAPWTYGFFACPRQARACPRRQKVRTTFPIGRSSTRCRCASAEPAASVLATAGLIAASCFALNCLVDPLWYLSGNILTAINHPFNERLAKLNRFLPRLKDYDCVIFGTSRATLLPEDKATEYRCFNLAISDGQASEYLLYADYLLKRGFAPRLLIVDIRRDDLIGPVKPPDVPDFVAAGDAPPSIFAIYLSLDALNFSIRTLRGDAPHHRYYDPEFHARLEVRSKRHYYNPPVPIKPQPPPLDLHPERAALYIQLRQKFPAARAIAYLPPESAWRIAAFRSLIYRPMGTSPCSTKTGRSRSSIAARCTTTSISGKSWRRRAIDSVRRATPR